MEKNTAEFCQLSFHNKMSFWLSSFGSIQVQCYDFKLSCIFVNISSFSTLGLIIDLNLVNKMLAQAEPNSITQVMINNLGYDL